MASNKETSKTSQPANRDKTGRFVKGQSGNPSGRPSLPPELKEYAREAATRLRKIASDPDCPIKVKADIEKWFAEMYYGRAGQRVEVEGNMNTTGTTEVKFIGELEEWSK